MTRLCLAVGILLATALPASAQDGTWTQVLRWEGSRNGSTETFEIKSQNWRITWSLSEPEPGTSTFQVFVKNPQGRTLTMAANAQRAGSAVKAMEGPGRYKLEVTSLGGADWVITVEELLSPTAEEFEKVKLSVEDGALVRQKDAILRLDNGSVTLLDRNTREPLRTIAVQDVWKAEYTFSPDRRHWLVLREGKGYAQLQLDRDNFRAVIAAVEARIGQQVEGIR